MFVCLPFARETNRWEKKRSGGRNYNYIAQIKGALYEKEFLSDVNLRPYHVENTWACPILEVKQRSPAKGKSVLFLYPSFFDALFQTVQFFCPFGVFKLFCHRFWLHPKRYFRVCTPSQDGRLWLTRNLLRHIFNRETQFLMDRYMCAWYVS
jgi:hypothetical protein